MTIASVVLAPGTAKHGDGTFRDTRDGNTHKTVAPFPGTPPCTSPCPCVRRDRPVAFEALHRSSADRA